MTDIAFLDQTTDSSECLAAWKGLRDLVQNPQGWKYVASLYDPSLEGWVHEFRHRDHPITHKTEFLLVPASPNWRPKEK
jgi:hypothetical protein